MNVHCPREDLDRFVRGELPPAEAEPVMSHLSGCPSCQRELSWLRAERDLLARRRSRPTPLPSAIWQQIEERIAVPAPKKWWQAGWNWVWSGPGDPQGRRSWLAYGCAAATCAALVVVTMMSAGTAHLSQWLTGTSDQNRAGLGSTPALLGSGEGSVPGVIPVVDRVDPATVAPAEQALDRAEQDYRKAFTELERSYQRRQRRLTPGAARHYAEQFKAVRRLMDMKMRAGREDDMDARMQRLDAYSAYMHAIQTTAYEIPEVYP